MTTSFSDLDKQIAAPEPASTDIVPTASSAVVPDSFFNNDGAVEGDFDKSDIKIPRLSVVQSVGGLSTQFAPGSIVYNKETLLGTLLKNPAGVVQGTDGVQVTLVRLKKYYLEDLPFGDDQPMPKFFATMDAARRAGYLPVQDKYTMGPGKYVKPVADADILIRGTTSDVTFPFDFLGTPYALARWTLQSTAYSRVGKQFFSDSQLALRSGLSGKFYSVSTRREQLGDNWVFVPKAALSGVNSPEFIQWIKDTVL